MLDATIANDSKDALCQSENLSCDDACEKTVYKYIKLLEASYPINSCFVNNCIGVSDDALSFDWDAPSI